MGEGGEQGQLVLMGSVGCLLYCTHPWQKDAPSCHEGSQQVGCEGIGKAGMMSSGSTKAASEIDIAVCPLSWENDVANSMVAVCGSSAAPTYCILHPTTTAHSAATSLAPLTLHVCCVLLLLHVQARRLLWKPMAL